MDGGDIHGIEKVASQFILDAVRDRTPKVAKPGVAKYLGPLCLYEDRDDTSVNALSVCVAI